ncbi:hypothetical protein VFPPC_01469 [Pochonia chlamydosporia 170]|uniref:Uncharacterized protein n=1 Tax=Pochonia chlamydosporia 170 TaxID=1380566 RepID=A0A179G8W8_METCM|nr:hypothetical protein VFPPC_01469 [Pochonia chlamydosporia 170]OAQ73861.2 hypothetical protein VFPPC_01469 [Pochonia chlamydosporia 170]
MRTLSLGPTVQAARNKCWSDTILGPAGRVVEHRVILFFSFLLLSRPNIGYACWLSWQCRVYLIQNGTINSGGGRLHCLEELIGGKQCVPGVMESLVFRMRLRPVAMAGEMEGGWDEVGLVDVSVNVDGRQTRVDRVGNRHGLHLGLLMRGDGRCWW